MKAAVAVAAALLAAPAFHASSRPLDAHVRHEVVASHHYYAKCPVPLSGLRVLTLRYWGFDRRVHTGQLVTKASSVGSLTAVFRKLYALRFPIRHMALTDEYGSAKQIPKDGDVTYSFSCRQAVASPCNGGKVTGTGSWSEHAYGLAVDLDPVENPYVGCGQTRDKTAVSFMNRSRMRRGMVTPAVIAAFRDVGWGWGGSWYGSTKDYMHFSANGH